MLDVESSVAIVSALVLILGAIGTFIKSMAESAKTRVEVKAMRQEAEEDRARARRMKDLLTQTVGEVTHNGGGSMKDAVVSLQAGQANLQTQMMGFGEDMRLMRADLSRIVDSVTHTDRRLHTRADIEHNLIYTKIEDVQEQVNDLVEKTEPPHVETNGEQDT